MTDNEKLARWQGKCYHVSDWGQTICKYCGRTNDPRYFDFDSINPNYLNDDAAAMSLLDTLVEKGLSPALEYSVDEQCWILSVVPFNQQGYYVCEDVEEYLAKTRREAVVAAVLELIGKEDV